MVHKARVLRQVFKYRSHRGSTNQLKRVANIRRFTTSALGEPTLPATTELLADESLLGRALMINDPILTLVSCEGRVFLAVGQITQIKIDTRTVESVTQELQSEDTVSISFQIMRLKMCLPTQAGPDSAEHWEWTQRFETSHRSPGRFIQAYNPDVSVSNPFEPTYIFPTIGLREMAAAMFEGMAPSSISLLPVVKSSPTFPYRVEGMYRKV